MLNDLSNTRDALNAFAKAVIKQSRSNLTRQGKKGSLYDSIKHNLTVSPNSFSLEFEMNDYGDFVDQGVSGKEKKYNTPYSFRNKMPPRKNILDWIKSKRLFLRDEKGRFKKGGQKTLAFLIQRSIFKKGIKPSLFFTKPFEQAFLNLPDQLTESYALDVEDFIDYTFRNHGVTNK